MSSPGKWNDLAPRVLSGVAMAGLGAGAVWAGGAFLLIVVAALCGLILWEIALMTNPEQKAEALQIGLIAAFGLLLAGLLPGQFSLPLVLAPVLVGAGMLRENRGLFAAYGAWIMLAGLGFLMIRGEGGVILLVWMVLVVVASDIAGYFVGKAVGGRRFWPAVSPKKTWSGTIGGWAAAALVGAVFALLGRAGWHFALLGVIVAFAAQMGDIAESALKRRLGVKDSSSLIPGHGGVFDRFDAMAGAAVLVLVLLALGIVDPAMGRG